MSLCYPKLQHNPSDAELVASTMEKPWKRRRPRALGQSQLRRPWRGVKSETSQHTQFR